MKAQTNPWPWVAATLIAQTGWGAYPVLARYLQTVSDLPSMSLVAMGNLLALLLLSFLILPNLNGRALRSPALWLFVLIVVGRGLSNFLAPRFTLSIYVQLITQMTPFIVAVLSTAVFHEHLPRYTGRAIVLCFIGAGLMMSGSFSGDNAAGGFTSSDWLGVGLATVSAFLLALYMIAVRRTARHHINGETLLFAQLLALGLSGLVLSFITGEDWSQWANNSPKDWLVFAALVIGVFAASNILQIGAIRHLGSALVSSTMAWRLISALVLAALLLDERLTSLWQLMGTVLVLVTITWYLRQQTGSYTMKG